MTRLASIACWALTDGQANGIASPMIFFNSTTTCVSDLSSKQWYFTYVFCFVRVESLFAESPCLCTHAHGGVLLRGPAFATQPSRFLESRLDGSIMFPFTAFQYLNIYIYATWGGGWQIQQKYTYTYIYIYMYICAHRTGILTPRNDPPI